MIMDESHHYRAEQGMKALNELRPLLGLELTATPLVSKGTKQVPFKNVVYEYPLSRAIEDGYTRTPYAVTRSDINFYNFGDEQLDRLMLTDGIACHERTKARLKAYAESHGKPVVKPFMLVVCKDTNHAAEVESYVRSDAFRNGAYRAKTIVVHSKQRGAESEANTRLLLEVEDAANGRLEQMMPELAKAAGATEELKASDPLTWTGLMNTCKAQAEETILRELVYS